MSRSRPFPSTSATGAFLSGALIICTLQHALAAAADTKLEAGVARVEITPGSFLPMYGYANRQCGPANGTHDPLFAKALVLAAGDAKVAIVSLDVGNLVSEALPREVARKLGIPLLLLAASHTHSAPAFLTADDEENLPGTAYFRELEGKIFEAARQASQSMFPARLSLGRGSVPLSYNRLVLRDDGRARANFSNPDRVPYGPVDPKFMLLRVEDETGAARALLVQYACHAVITGPTSCKYSADFPGVLQARVDTALPGIQCMFIQGVAGDINPLLQGRTGDEQKGSLLAAEVIKANRSLRSASPDSYSIQSASETLRFTDRWNKEKSIEVGIAAVLVNHEIAIAAMPGEPFHKLQTMWKSQADVPSPLFFGYTYAGSGTWPGYIPDLRSAAYGGYGADASTRIEVGAGEVLVQRHLIQLYQLLGMGRARPGRP
jgi:neutral ceramidase